MPYPNTRFETNDALTRKKWSKELFRVILPEVEFNYLVGKGTDSIVQMRTELGKGEGDTIKFGIRRPLTGAGTVGRDTVEGTEEKLLFQDFSMTVEELNHAVDTGGKMDEQRVPYNLMEEGKTGLADWWADKLSDLVVNTIAGNSSFTIAGKTFAQACEEPDTGHFITVNDVAESSLGAADVIDLPFLDRLKQRAEMPASGCDKVRPLKNGGKNYYRVILHNYAFDALRQGMNIGDWGDLKRQANELKLPDVEIAYNGLLITKSERMPSKYTNIYRAVLLGAQAACWAWGGAGESKSTIMSFIPYEKDAKRYVMIRGGGIFGCKKTRFNSKDYGVITAASYAIPLS